MKPKKYKVMIDIYKGVLNNQVIEFTTQDNGSNVLEFEILEDKVTPYNLDGCIVRMVINGQQQDCTIVDGANGQVKIVLLQSMFSQVGLVTAELQIYDATNQTLRLTTPRFRYNVKKSLMDDETVQADPNYSILQNMILEVTGANEIADKAKTTAEAALTKSNQAVTTINNEVAKVNKAVTDAQTALDRAESVVTQEELAQKVMLDGKDTKFDFIKNKVMQDGLCTYIGSINDYSGLKEFPFTQEVKNFTLQMKMNFNKLTNGKELGKLVGFKVNEFSFQLVTWENYFYLVFYDKNDVRRVYKATVAVGLNKWINVVVSGDISKPTLTMNNKENPLVLSDSNAPNIKVFNKLFIGINNSADGLIKSVVLTNRILSGQESQHNFSALDNPESIKELHTTDSTGKTSILNLASSEDFVEMSTGRTLREEYMGVLKTMGKEFTSADGSPIQVPNGIDARIIDAEIKGQSVKSIANVDDRFRTAVGDGTIKVALAISDIGLVKPSSDYTLVTEVISNTLNGDFKLVSINTSNMMMDTNDSVSAGKTGIFIVKLRSKANLSGTSQIIRHALTADSTSGSITYRSCVFEGDLTKVVKGFAPFGLVSTEAIISNNGEEYPIYANEEDRANKKVILLNGAGSVSDKLELKDDGSQILTSNAPLVSITGDNSWTLAASSSQPSNEYLRLVAVPDMLNPLICDKYPLVNISAVPNSGGLIGNSYRLEMYLKKSDIGYVSEDNNATVNEKVKEYLKTTGGFKYIGDGSKKPTVTSIDKSITPTIRTHNQTNILEAGGAVKPSSFKVTVPVDKLAEIEARLQALESTTVDVVLNK